MEFFKELESHETTKVTQLRKGKPAEQEEFDRLLREVEVELDSASSRAPRPAAPEASEPSAAADAASE
jgi:hypothetical protein